MNSPRHLAASLFRSGRPTLARAVAALAGPPTDRAHLLLDPRDHDACDTFTTGVVLRDCATDGHYLCEDCTRIDPATAKDRAQ